MDAYNTSIGGLSEVQLNLYKLGTSPSGHTSMVVLFNLTVTCDFKWNLYYLGESINISRCSLLNDSPALLNNTSSIKRVLHKIDNCRICIGNPDEKFNVLVKFREGNFKDQSG